MNLMNVIGGISDRHIAEFADVKRQKKRITHKGIFISAAACLAVIITAASAVMFEKKIPQSSYTSQGSNTSQNSNASQGSSTLQSGNISESNNTSASNFTSEDDYPPAGVFPHVYFNDRVYRYYEYNCYGEFPNEISELPEGYIQVGEITTNDRNNKKVNGYGEGPKVGEKIYQDPDHPEDLYVYTALFMGGRYTYELFVDSTFYRVRINDKTFVEDWSVGSFRLLENLPSGYSRIGEVTTNDRDSRYADGYGQALSIGDEIYGCSENPDIVYVCTNKTSSRIKYVRLIAFDE
ncbi:MAG: hypothetical protein K2N56_02060 [Oscillospiraceae bacterium]|nr:hypothetical protein [Oscillospiraceae bacterium]